MGSNVTEGGLIPLAEIPNLAKPKEWADVGYRSMREQPDA